MSNPSWYNEAEKMYVEEKLPYYKIGEFLGVCRKTISYWLRKNGHHSNEKYVRNIKNTTRKYFVNDDVFEKIDSPEKAYWLGFLYADGCINGSRNTVELGVAEKDKSIIEDFNLFSESTYPITEKKKYHMKYDKTYIGYRTAVSSKKMVEDLKNQGCLERKSLILEWPKKLQPVFYSHFVRGYFDGDGSVYIHKKQNTISSEILGTKDMLIELQKNLPKKIKSYIHDFNHAKNTFRIQMHGENALAFLEWMYQDKNYYLPRKYEKYQLALSSRNVRNELGKIGES